MTASAWAIDVLLLVSLVITLFSCIALAAVRDFFNRLHYLAPVTTVSITLLVIAVTVKYGWGQATIKTLLVWFVLLLINSVLTHATARAARVRELGHWTPDPKEQISGTRHGGK